METNTGKIATLALTTLAVIVIVNNYRSKEFWCGMGALLILGTSIKTYNK